MSYGRILFGEGKIEKVMKNVILSLAKAIYETVNDF